MASSRPVGEEFFEPSARRRGARNCNCYYEEDEPGVAASLQGVATGLTCSKLWSRVAYTQAWACYMVHRLKQRSPQMARSLTPAEVWCRQCDKPATVERAVKGETRSYCGKHDPDPRPRRIPDSITDPWLRGQWARTVR